MNKLTSIVLVGSLSMLAVGAAKAAASPEDAKRLGDTLTAFGAEKAGSANGAIPAYTGGLSTPPSGHKPGGPSWEDPYKSDKPVFSIDAKSMAPYAEQLTPGTKVLLQRDPSFRIDVYPTRRTMYYPEWVLDNTKKNATAAKLTGQIQGDGVDGAYGGIPFPIPKDGYEVMWNTYLHYQPVYMDLRGSGYLMDSTGGLTETYNAGTITSTPFYDNTKDKLPDSFYEKYVTNLNAPTTQSGTKVAQFYTIDNSQQDQQSWLYTPGQRRVRVAPEFKYDTPIAQDSGAIFYDELFGMAGRLDRYDFVLKGKKEIIVPYNNYGLAADKIGDVTEAKKLNPDKVRWERHRVWVVEATLKADKRHAFARRTFYVDEDSWTISVAEAYDNNQQLNRVLYGFPLFFYEKNLGGLSNQSFVVYDLLKGSYYLNNFSNAVGANHLIVKDSVANPQQFTPAGLAGSGLQ